MKQLFTLCLSVGLLTAAPLATVAAPSHPVRQVTADDGLVAYFTHRLEGDATPYASKAKLDLSEIRQARERVWQAWCEANRRLDEEKLATPGELMEASAASWQLPDSLEPNAVMPYYWGTKGAARPERGYPLFLYLHGSGPKAREWATGLAICRGFDDAPSLYFIPQIPNEGGYYRWWQRAKLFAWDRLLRQSLAAGWVDPDRVYFFGISEGGYGSQRLASFYADYLAAAGPMAGGEPLKNAPAENCRNIGFMLRTGADDNGFYRNRLTGYVADALDSLRRLHPAGYVHRVELIPCTGHGIDYRPTTPWLKQFVRNPWPRQVSWEDYDLDGVRRAGFYNLAVPPRTGDPAARTYYEMTIEDNQVDLSVSDVAYTTTERDPHWGIELKFARRLTPAASGRLTLYLNDALVDLSREVTVTVNGRRVFRGRVRPTLAAMVNSCATFFDPRRVFPAAVEVEW